MLLSWRRVCAEDGQINRAAVELFICLRGKSGGVEGGFSQNGTAARSARDGSQPRLLLSCWPKPLSVANFLQPSVLGPESQSAALLRAVKKGANFMSASFNK